MKYSIINSSNDASVSYDRNLTSKASDINHTTLPKTVAGVTLGNMVEWFDFAIYSSMAMTMAKSFSRVPAVMTS